jgi:hypothetical protein
MVRVWQHDKRTDDYKNCVRELMKKEVGKAQTLKKKKRKKSQTNK